MKSATYGENCNISHGVHTDYFSKLCDGKGMYFGKINKEVLADPVPECEKEFELKY